MPSRSPRPDSWWPEVMAFDGPAVSGEVKRLSVDELVELMSAAREAVLDGVEGVSAVGRPKWTAEHREDIIRVYLTIYGVEAPGLYRCFVCPHLTDGSMFIFTLDVLMARFAALQALTLDEVIELVHRLLQGLPPLPVDHPDVHALPDDS